MLPILTIKFYYVIRWRSSVRIYSDFFIWDGGQNFRTMKAIKKMLVVGLLSSKTIEYLHNSRAGSRGSVLLVNCSQKIWSYKLWRIGNWFRDLSWRQTIWEKCQKDDEHSRLKKMKNEKWCSEIFLTFMHRSISPRQNTMLVRVNFWQHFLYKNILKTTSWYMKSYQKSKQPKTILQKYIIPDL